MAHAVKFLILLVVSGAILTACATRPVVRSGVATAPFAVERDLSGENIARGEFRSITGSRRVFTAHLNGTWDGRVLTLVEDFTFDDGERDRKTWRLERLANGEWRGQREDVVGYARGFQDGNVFRLEYDVMLSTGNGARRVRFRDVLALQREGVILNTATVGWWGLRVGTVQLTMERPATAALPR